MQPKSLFDDEAAVSPVVGTVLMIAITVVLAATVGTAMLGIGGQVKETGPSANLAFIYTASGGSFDAATDGDTIEILHDGGSSFEQDEVTVQVGDQEFEDLDTTGNGVSKAWPETVRTGRTLELDDGDATDGFESGSTVRVVWHGPSGGTSQTIAGAEVP
jgi:flagellin-like protein